METPGRTVAGDYSERHCLTGAREGFALPALQIVPLGELLRLDWVPSHLESQRISFTEQGSLHIPKSEFRKAAKDFVAAVSGRLREYGILSTLLQEEFDAVLNTTEDEEQFCAAAAALGLDPYALMEEQSAEILEVSERVPKGLRQEFFAVADSERLRADASVLVNALGLSRSKAKHFDQLRELKTSLRLDAQLQGAPWQQGYDLARVLRHQVGLDGDMVSSGRAIEALGLGADDNLAILAPDSAEARIDAVVDINTEGSPGFAVASRSKQTRAFSWCRALCEYLTTSINEPLIVTRARSERQKRNRAFAAEFLVPSAHLERRLDSDLLSGEDLDDLALEFDVSPWVIRHQLENHNLGRVLP